eukprot:CAMPEP_0172696394 /NCGR_PEP_ID=MMETSP1074-20121228/28024_1 /TAXON_ID=2916 /ORGANISM="Ceratium fusus, Strain PA161109" /LENGTH=72 /DNA_ID=CAMNT_0013517133 /DNA_START=638 /DNA_END=856 /DNA_ORIENTATION=+
MIEVTSSTQPPKVPMTALSPVANTLPPKPWCTIPRVGLEAWWIANSTLQSGNNPSHWLGEIKLQWLCVMDHI